MAWPIVWGVWWAKVCAAVWDIWGRLWAMPWFENGVTLG